MRFFKLNYLVISILISKTLWAQTNIDSLKNTLLKTSSDTTYVETLNKLTKVYRLSNPIIALDYAIKAEKIAENCNYKKGQALAYYNIAMLHADKGNNELAVENYKRSIKIYQQKNNNLGLSNAYENLGIIFFNQKQFEKALEYHYQSLKIKKTLNDSVRIANSYNNIGLVFYKQEKYDKALIQFYNSLRLKESLNDKYGMACSYKNIGEIYYEIASYEQAQVNLERSLKLFEETNNPSGISGSLLYLVEIYFIQNMIIKAQDAVSRCLKLNLNQGNIKGIAESYLKNGKINTSMGKPNEAYKNYQNSLKYYQKIGYNKGVIDSRYALADYYFDLNDFENAKTQLKKALEISEDSTNFIIEKYQIIKMLASIYLRQENYYHASEILQQVNILADSISKINSTKNISKIQRKFEFDKHMQEKETDAVRINADRKIHIHKINMVRNIVVIILLFFTITILILSKKSSEIKNKNKELLKQKNKIDKQIIELKTVKNELEKTTQTKEKFLSIIGHDLRNPFNAINSIVSVLTENTETLDHASLLKYLYIIKDAGANASSLLDNLLDWAKAESKNFTAKNEVVLINYILRGNILLIKEMARQKEIEIIEELQANPSVSIDKNMINTVIRNLLSNALKFTNPGGKIWVKTLVKGNEVKIIVQDTGIGISENQLSNLFEPSIIKQGLDGLASSGLGLILCKEFLAQNRQELRVDSKVNFGTTFWFYLPLIK